METYDTTKDVDIDTKGDNANAEYYNDVNGNQYNDDAIHNEEVESAEIKQECENMKRTKQRT